MLGASGAGIAAAALVGTLYRDGPYPFERRPFSWGLVGRIVRDRRTMLATQLVLGLAVGIPARAVPSAPEITFGHVLSDFNGAVRLGQARIAIDPSNGEAVVAEGREVRRLPPQAVRQVISAATAARVREMLTAVVAEGTGQRASVAGYAVGGKTGTAQKLDPVTRVYSRKPGVLSFVGFVPADEPRLVMLALLDEPKTVAWGSEVAAPLFAAVAAPALRYLGVPPTNQPSGLRKGRISSASQRVS